MIVSDSRHPADRCDPGSRVARERVSSVDTYDDIVDAVFRPATRVGISDVDFWAPGSGHQVVRALEAGVATATLVLRTDLSRRALVELPALSVSPAARRVVVSFRKYDPFGSILEQDFAGGAESAALRILSGVYRLVPERAKPLVVATVVMCERVVALREIGAVVGLGKGEPHRRYELCCFPAFPRVNAACVGAHALGGVEVGRSPASCAERAGFPTLKKLNEYLGYHFERTLSQLRDEGGANAMIKRIAGWTRGAQEGVSPPSRSEDIAVN